MGFRYNTYLIINKSISKFARSTVDSLSLVNDLRNLGIEVLFENENISSFNLSIDIMLSIMSAFAEDEANIIRLIYKLYLDGYGLNKICNYLETNGYKTVRGNSSWSVRTIVSILENEKYKGDATMQKTFTPDFKSNETKLNTDELPMYKVIDTHPAIIDNDTFDKVQELRRIKSIRYSNNLGE